MICRLILYLPSPIKRWLWKQFVVGECGAIILADTRCRADGSKAFCQQTGKALELIRLKDGRRFRRVQRHLRYIINGELTLGVGAYDERLGACMVDFERFKFEKYPHAAPCLYAATLVHEATHGEIRKRGIAWTKRNRQRIERLCHLETARFMGRFKRELGEGWLARAYKPGDYEKRWKMSLWKLAKLRWRRKGEKMSA